MKTEKLSSENENGNNANTVLAADVIKLTPKQNAVINLLQNGWSLITDMEVKGAWVCNSKYQFHINNGLFFRLVNMGLIYQGGSDVGYSFILTREGKEIKTKSINFDGKVICS
jgi:hypothetical protein